MNGGNLTLGPAEKDEVETAVALVDQISGVSGGGGGKAKVITT